MAYHISQLKKNHTHFKRILVRFWNNCPREKLPLTPIPNPNPDPTPNRGAIFLWEIVRIPLVVPELLVTEFLLLLQK